MLASRWAVWVQATIERRLDLFVLVRNASRIAADDAYGFASMQLQLLLSRLEPPWQVTACLPAACESIVGVALHTADILAHRAQLGNGETCMQDVELVVATVYELGEGAPEAALKPGSGALAAAVLGVHLTRASEPAASGRSAAA